MNKEDKIAQLLRVVVLRLTYCEAIANHPASMGKKDFDKTSPVDIFFKNVCVMSFSDVVLILGSLLGKDKRLISFWNWDTFPKSKENELISLKVFFESSGLNQIRNQIIAHQDDSHLANTFPDWRIRTYINPIYIERAQKILLELIRLFNLHTMELKKPYAPEYFGNCSARGEILAILNFAKPTLTNDHII